MTVEGNAELFHTTSDANMSYDFLSFSFHTIFLVCTGKSFTVIQLFNDLPKGLNLIYFPNGRFQRTLEDDKIFKGGVYE